MVNHRLITFVGLAVLFYVEYIFWIVPVWAITAELIAIYLDTTKSQSKKTTFGYQQYTWEQLSVHNTQESAWIAVKGKVYDITGFLNNHPGGKEFLLMNAGRDASQAFQCYHPFTKKPEQVIQKFYIGELKTNESPQFQPDSGFYEELSSKINEFFKSNNINPKSPVPGILRAIPLYCLFLYTFYITFISGESSIQSRLVACITFGVCQALNTLHIMHDASHGAVGNNETWWWVIGRFSLDWMSGSSMVAWHYQHLIGHHIYTNVMQSDPDLPQSKNGDVRRLVPFQVWKKLYTWQQYYMPVLYGLLSLRSRWYDVFEIFYLETNGPVRVNPILLQDQLRQSASKLFWFFWRYYIPVKVMGMDLGMFVALFLLSELVTGYWLAINFQVSHVSDEAEYFYNDVQKLKEDKTSITLPIEWAKLQLKTSVDYGHHSWIQTYLSGALNYQVVHHLFPGVSQYHYPRIAPIVKDVCMKHGLKYNEFPNFWQAWKSHVAHLRNMGEQGKLVSFKHE